MLKNKKRIATGILSAYIALVFAQSLFSKFSGSPETQNIFGTLNSWAANEFGYENLFLPPGIFNAYNIASAELLASILLLVGLLINKRALCFIGALLSFCIINGAITFHLFTPLGIEVNDDGGAMFKLACGVWLCSILIMTINLDAIFKKLEMTPKSPAEA